jgi:hypothetical protein
MAIWLMLGEALIGFLLVDPGVQTAAKTRLRAEVVDADTGRAIPSRVSIRGADGSWFFPESDSPQGSALPYRKTAIGHPAIVEMHTTLSAHPFSVRLSSGRYVITAERGKEYHLERREIAVGAEPVDVVIRLRRWVDMPQAGWYSGDTHTHRTLAELPNVLLAEDLNLAFPLLDWVREAFVAPVERRAQSFHDPGPEPIKVDATHLIVPRNTEYEIFTVARAGHTLGAFFVLNHQTPLQIGVPPVGPVAARAHNEGALIELDKHNWPWSMALVPIMPVDLFELSNNHIWETDFAFGGFGEAPAEFMAVEKNAQGYTERGWIDYGFQNYYTLLDCGFPLRPTAGTASGVHPVPLGFGRVYVRLDEGLSARAWLRGLDAGRSFVTTGPMLFVTLDGQDPGHRFQHSEAKAREMRLSGKGQSARPLGRIEIVVNGAVVRKVEPANHETDRRAYESPIDVPLRFETSSWVAVRCFEDRRDGRVRFAHTGPFYIDVAGRPLRPRKVEVEYLIKRVEAQIQRGAAVLPAAALDEYRKALQIYRKIAETAR